MTQTVQIVAAHPLELKELRKRFGHGALKLAGGERFLFEDILIEVSLCGIGKDEVEAFCSRYAQRDILPACIVNIGFVGALEAKIEWGCWMLCDQIYCYDQDAVQGCYFPADSRLMKAAREYFACKKVDYRVGSLVTVDNAHSDQESKDQLYRATEAVVVDMEAYHLALAAQRMNVPFAVIKIVSDTVSDLAENVIKSRGQILSGSIAQIIPDLISKLVSFNGSKRSYPHLQPKQ